MLTENQLNEEKKQTDAEKAINEENIKKKEELCKRAKAIAEADDLTDGALKLNNIFEEWKTIRNGHTEREDQLWEEFQSYRAKYKAAREGLKEKNKILKEEIIKEADAILEMENFKEASAKLAELMDRWKSIRSAGRDEDERLWQLFSQRREAFRNKRNDFVKMQQEGRDNNRSIKLGIIERARAIANSDIQDWKKASDEMFALMEEWKAVGFAGNDCNEQLWEDFNAARSVFYDKRKAIYAEMDAEYMEVAKVKKSLIDRAKEIAALEDYSQETTELMKDLDAQWKQAGSAGRRMENDLWEEFRLAKEVFWQKKHEIADEKRKQWASKAQDIINRKKQQRDNLEKQIRELEKSKRQSGFAEIDKIMSMDKWIAQKQKIIDELNAEISDIEKRMK